MYGLQVYELFVVGIVFVFVKPSIQYLNAYTGILSVNLKNDSLFSFLAKVVCRINEYQTKLRTTKRQWKH